MLSVWLLQGCESDKKYEKGFQVNEITQDEQGNTVVGLPIDSLTYKTAPKEVLPTYHSAYKITPIFKINYDKKGRPFTGSVDFYNNYAVDDPPYEKYYDPIRQEYVRVKKENLKHVWNGNFMPGFSAIYGYNMVNISLFNSNDKTQKELFDKPVLVRTFYYPADTQDIVNYEPIERKFYMVSVYNEDSNKDGYINMKDLRKLYRFDLDGNNPKELLPQGFSAQSSEYDSQNDLMYVFAKQDLNKNGQIEADEPTIIYWIDLKDTENRGFLYK